MKNSLSFINVYKKKNLRSGVDTQLIYGDRFKIIKKEEKWLKIKNQEDSYKGFIKKNNFPLNEKSTHKVSVLKANPYSK